MDLSKTIPQRRNANRHTQRGMSELERSIQQDGMISAITCAANGEIFDGSARREVLETAGLEDAIIVRSDGSRPIIHIREDIPDADDPRAIRLGLAANKIAADNLDWDAVLLAELAAQDATLLEGLFRQDELDALLASVAAPIVPGAGGDEFDTAPADGPTRTQAGDLWSLGRHRLLVGDCTDPANVARLMDGGKATMCWADPPFGINYTGHGASKDGRANKFAAIQGDDNPSADWLPLAVPCPGGAIYLKTTWAVLHAWEQFLGDVCDVRAHIVWDRCSHSAGDVTGGYATQSEIILFGTIGRHKTNQFDTDVWHIARATTGAPETRTGHPYESPVELPKRAIENSSRPGDIVYDPFLGSGTTLIAAERTGRTCYGCEISEVYADVILRRWEAETGQAAQKVDA